VPTAPLFKPLAAQQPPGWTAAPASRNQSPPAPAGLLRDYLHDC